MMPSAAEQHTTIQPAQRVGLAATHQMVGGAGIALAFAAAITAVVVMSSSSSPPAAPTAQTVTALAEPILEQAEPPVPNAVPIAVPVIDIARPVSAPHSFPTPTSSPTSEPASRQCGLAQRKFYLAGNGTIRVRAGENVSPPIELEAYPKEVVFPVSRPQSGPVEETVVVEGTARTVIMTSDLPGFRKTFNRLRGSSSFQAHWQPLRNC
jgi:hypothetical protein